MGQDKMTIYDTKKPLELLPKALIYSTLIKVFPTSIKF